MVYDKGFIKSDKLYMLEEYHRTTDLLNLSSDVERFTSSLSKIGESCIVGLVGKLGSGKTTFLNQFVGSIEDPVFEFEAWKYPGRKDLWENFVLEIAEQLGNKPEYMNKIDGTENDGKKTLFEMLINLPGKWRDYVPGIKSIETGVNYFLQTSPATRTFQLQELLKELLKSIKSDTVYIAIEDADRAGDEGLFFLETLSYYVKEILQDKRIIVLALIGEENYSLKEKKLSFQKCIDIELEHSIKEPSFEQFVDELFIEEITSDNIRKGQVVSFFEGLFKELDSTTMRKIKRRLRKANLQYQILVEDQKTGIDRRVSIMLEFAKVYSPGEKKSYFDFWKEKGEIDAHGTIFGALLNCIIFDNHRLDQQPISSIYTKDRQTEEVTLVERSWTARLVKIVKKDYASISQQAKDDPIRYYKDKYNNDDPNYFGLSYKYFE